MRVREKPMPGREQVTDYEGIRGIPFVKPGQRRDTGSWRVFTPVVDGKKCTGCKLCWLFCPEAAISWKNSRPVIDYGVCKGCLVCSHECKSGAIAAKRLKRKI